MKSVATQSTSLVALSLFLLLIQSLVVMCEKPVLRFRDDGTFKIVQFTDLHYGEQETYDQLNYISQENVLEAEKPDFVMLSGDMISGYTERFEDGTQYKKVWDMLTKPMIKRNIPWSITFGNHDAEGPWTSAMINELDMSYNLSLSQQGPSDIAGEGNYILKVLGSNNSQDIASLIYIFDSDTPECNGNGSWGCIQPNQVQWYKNQSDFYKIPAIAYVHVPPVEVIDLWNTGTVVGDFGDSGVCCYYTEHSKFIETMVAQKDVKALYFGHDHRNDYIGDYYGMDLGYGRKSGYGSYDPKYAQGARVVQIQEKPYSVDTWIRNVHGEKETQKVHVAKDQERVPMYCCTPLDSQNNAYWGLYLGVCCAILAISFLIQWKFLKKKDSTAYQLVHL
eukprot:gene2511-2868_t